MVWVLGGAECSRSKPAEYGPKSNQLELQWEFETKYPEYLCTSGDYVVVSKSEREIVCLSMSSGEVEWTFKNNIDENVSTCLPPISNKGRIYYASGGGLTCFEVDTGKIVWEYECKVGTEFTTNPIILGDTVYAITPYYSDHRSKGMLIGVGFDGSVRLEQELDVSVRWGFSQLFTNGNYLLACLDYDFVCFDTNGKIIYNTHVGPGEKISDGNKVLTFRVVTEKNTHNGRPDEIKCHSSVSGVKLWEFIPEHVLKGPLGEPSLYDSEVFCIYSVRIRSGSKNVLYSLNLKNGAVNWKQDIDETGSIMACGERLYISGNAYSAKDGRKLKSLDREV